jgi:hypothetical protein
MIRVQARTASRSVRGWDSKLGREFVKREKFVLMLMLGQNLSGTDEEMWRRCPATTIPGP